MSTVVEDSQKTVGIIGIVIIGMDNLFGSKKK